MSTFITQADTIAFLSSLPEQSVEAVVTSPPYNLGMAYGCYRDSRDDYDLWTVEWLAQALRVSRKGVFLNIGGKASGQTELFRTMGAIAEAYTIQNAIVWAKSVTIDGLTHGHFKPINSCLYVNNCHEYVLHVVNELAPVDRLSIGVPFTDKSNIARFKGNRGRDRRCRGSVWHLPYETRQKKLEHPSTYPMDLALMMIGLAGGDGTIVDPFLGSGTTAVACQQMGRDFMGCDIDPDYIAMAWLAVRMAMDKDRHANREKHCATPDHEGAPRAA